MLQLKQNQVDYESMKLETKRLRMDVEELQAELEELTKLKAIVERNLEDAIISLEQEREQKHAYKKELDQRITNESVFNLQNLASLGLGLGLGDSSKSDSHDHEASENSALQQIEADFTSTEDGGLNKVKAGSNSTNKLGTSPVGDLFSEIHVTEVRKLEELLSKSEIEKAGLEKALEDTNVSLEAAKKDIEEQREKIAQMKAHITSVTSLNNSASDLNDLELEEEEAAEDYGTDPEIASMKRSLKQKDRGYAAALKQIAELQEQVKVLEGKLGGDKESQNDLQDEVTKLKNKVIEYEQSMKSLQEVYECKYVILDFNIDASSVSFNWFH